MKIVIIDKAKDLFGKYFKKLQEMLDKKRKQRNG